MGHFSVSKECGFIHDSRTPLWQDGNTNPRGREGDLSQDYV